MEHSEVIECFSISKDQEDKTSCLKLSCADKFYLAEENRKQCIALQFSHRLDPVRLTEALFQAVESFPTVGSRIIMHNEEEYFQIHGEDIKIFQVDVEHKVLLDVDEWTPAFQRFSRQVFADSKPLFQSFLVRSNQEPSNCLLMCGFEHCLGDGASYAMFLRAWSEQYSKLVPETAPHDSVPAAASCNLRAGGSGLSSAPLGPSRYTFSPESIAKLKSEAAQSHTQHNPPADDAWQPSANDVLLAHMACALAPLRRTTCGPEEDCARVLVLADCRGRTWEKDRFGNAVRAALLAPMLVHHSSIASRSWDLLYVGNLIGGMIKSV
jgi:hypothetical protein